MKHLQKILGYCRNRKFFRATPPGSAGCDCLLTDKRSYP